MGFFAAQNTTLDSVQLRHILHIEASYWKNKTGFAVLINNFQGYLEAR